MRTSSRVKLQRDGRYLIEFLTPMGMPQGVFLTEPLILEDVANDLADGIVEVINRINEKEYGNDAD